jgi:hypothetical protein
VWLGLVPRQANRIRLGSMIGKQAMRRRAEIVERSFAFDPSNGG